MVINELRVIEALSTNRSLTKVLNQMNEAECQTAIKLEVKSGKRQQILIRLHRRFGVLRNKRERKELMELCNDG